MPARRPLLVAPVAAALLLSGCGSAPAPSASAPAGDGARAAAGPATPMRVSPTDLRLGDASVARAGGRLRGLRVGPRRVDPSALGGRSGEDRAGLGAGAGCADRDLMPDAGNLAAVTAATLCLLNGERADAGLQPLTTDARLAQGALAHSRDMVARRFFAHDSPEGDDVVDRLRASGYIPSDRRWLVGENLAWGTGTLATPARIVAAWMSSPGHRANVLRADFREIGFGIVVGNPRSGPGDGATYATTFGTVGDPSATRRAPVQQVAAVRDTATRRAAARRAAERRRARKVKARKAAARRKAAAARARRRA